ncbi:MAG TPA: serine/threonine-protein kinase [Kofleriaceae bacterium]|jgi:serine/threonine-protein kinase
MSGAHDDTVASESLPKASEPPATPVAETIANRYKLVRWLGGGGMGRVYEVYDEELAEKVALKVLKSGLSDEAIERFRREVRLTRRIQHRNVARMFDIGQHNGDKFLTMELVDGGSLQRELTAPIGWPRVQKLATQICDGLAAAHAVGVIHRDLKPDNVLVENGTDRVVITDFGIARTAEDESVTQIGAVIGTPRYMAPEQLAGQQVDARVDLFSLGVMLFELASGKRPWSGDNLIAIAVAQQTQPPRKLVAPNFPAGFEGLVLKCLAVDRDERIASAAEVGTTLANLTLSDQAPQRPTPPRISLTTPPVGVSTFGTGSGSGTVATTGGTMGGTFDARPEETMVAVLPFSCAPADEYLADGAFEDVIDTLSTTPGLRVKPAGVARTAVTDPRAIGQSLAVDLVIAGSLRRTPTGLRVSARLIAVADGFQIWAHKVDTSEGELLVTTSQLSGGIIEALSAKAKEAATRGGMDPRAVDLYLRAKSEQRRFWGEHQQNAKELLEHALAISPNVPQLLGAHAYASVQTWIRKMNPDLIAGAIASVERGLATGTPDAYLAAGSLRLNRGDHVGAGQAYGIALAKAPMSSMVNEHVGRVLCEIDSIKTGRHHLDVALALDPTRWPVVDGDLVRLDLMEGKTDAVDARIQRLFTDSDPAFKQLGAVYIARLSVWRRDYSQIEKALSQLGSRLGTGGGDQVKFYAAWKAGTPVDSPTWRASMDGLMAASHPHRMVTMNLQRMAEMAMAMDRFDDAWYTLELADKSGLIDRVWIENCPLFLEYQNEPRVAAVRASVTNRAREMLTALRSARV